MAAEMKALISETRWSVEKTIGLMIDASLSYGDLQNLRSALSLEYSADHDRCLHSKWLINPKTEDLQRPRQLRLPEPIPPVDKIRKAFKHFEEDLRIEISEDGKIASHRFLKRMKELHSEHRALSLISPLVGTAEYLCASDSVHI